jgi:hypothetical protein
MRERRGSIPEELKSQEADSPGVIHRIRQLRRFQFRVECYLTNRVSSACYEEAVETN